MKKWLLALLLIPIFSYGINPRYTYRTRVHIVDGFYRGNSGIIIGIRQECKDGYIFKVVSPCYTVRITISKFEAIEAIEDIIPEDYLVIVK